MKKFDNVIAKRRHVIVDEKDMMSVLKVLDGAFHKGRMAIHANMEIGNCGWSGEPNKWFIQFDATDRKWKYIIAEMSHINRKIVLKEDNRFHLT